MDLNRRDLLKGGAAGFLLGFLFRGRDGKLREEPEVVEQPPSAVTIRSVPQQAFRPQRLVIAGTVIGKRMVPETRFVPCAVCDDRFENEDDDEDMDENEDADDDYCEACDDLGGKLVETGEMVEKNVTVVPWTIESMTIGTRDQFATASAMPGDIFGAGAVDNFANFDAAGASQEIAMVVRYTGDKPDGEVFHAAMIGTSVGDDGVPRQVILPISSEKKIVA